MLEQIDNIAATISKNGSNPIDPDVFAKKAAACVILGIVMDSSFTYEDAKLQKFIDLAEDWASMFFDTSSFQALDTLPSWLSSIVVSGFKKKVVKSTNDFREFLLDYIKPHMDEFDPENPRDFIDGYLKEFGADQFDPKSMANNVIVFTSDAVLSVASIFTTALFYIAKHQDVQSRLQAQLDHVVGSSRKATTKDKSSLPLIEAFLNETLRIMTPVIALPPRETQRHTRVKGYNIPKGSLIMANVWRIHMNPAFYKDPKHFRLEHFLKEDGSIIHSPEALVPFGIGKQHH